MKKYVYEHDINKIPFHRLCKNVVILRGLAHSHYLFETKKDFFEKHNFIFLIRQSWHHNDQIFKDGLAEVKNNNLKLENIYFLHNTLDELERGKKFGFNGIHCNANCFQNEESYPIIDVNKEYKAVYTARYEKCKRHEMVPDRNDVALISLNWPPDIKNIFKHCVIKEHLSPKQVSEMINKSYYGLCLSAEEGQCRAAIEYLYCGVPIISTPSLGGRDVWYNRDNHIIVNSKKEIIDVFENFYNFNGKKIRYDAISLAKQFRQNLFNLLEKLNEKFINSIFSFSKGNPDIIVEKLNENA
jgi:glycosyltransferase involved in cell wall biosynthesis